MNNQALDKRLIEFEQNFIVQIKSELDIVNDGCKELDLLSEGSLLNTERSTNKSVIEKFTKVKAGICAICIEHMMVVRAQNIQDCYFTDDPLSS